MWASYAHTCCTSGAFCCEHALHMLILTGIVLGCQSRFGLDNMLGTMQW